MMLQLGVIRKLRLLDPLFVVTNIPKEKYFVFEVPQILIHGFMVAEWQSYGDLVLSSLACRQRMSVQI